MSIVNNDGFIKSENIKIFPCAYRGEGIDPEARSQTEYNLTHTGMQLPAPYNMGYIVSDNSGDASVTDKYIEFALGGYHFRIAWDSSTDSDIFKNKWVAIKVSPVDLGANNSIASLKSSILMSLASEASVGSPLDTEDGYFAGLKILNSEPSSIDTDYTHWLQLYTNTGLNTTLLLPELYAGSAIGTVGIGRKPTTSEIFVVKAQAGGDKAVVSSNTTKFINDTFTVVDSSNNAQISISDKNLVVEKDTKTETLHTTGDAEIGGVLISKHKNFSSSTNELNFWPKSSTATEIIINCRAGDINEKLDTPIQTFIFANGQYQSAENSYKLANLRINKAELKELKFSGSTGESFSIDDTIKKYFVDLIYPVGSIFETTNDAFNTAAKVAQHFGGTWEVFGAGQVLVAAGTLATGVGNEQKTFTLGDTGGNYYMQQHGHTWSNTHDHKNTFELKSLNNMSGVKNQTSTNGWHSHGINYYETGGGGAYGDAAPANGTLHVGSTISNGDHFHYIYLTGSISEAEISGSTTIAGAGNSQNMQPYIVVYRYRRIS